jgi:hypothetical protein
MGGGPQKAGYLYFAQYSPISQGVGPDIWSDMDEGNAETPDERWALWRWLTTD